MFETEFCKIEYLENHNAVICKWKKFSSFENYRTPLEFGLKLINEHIASLWITDTTNGFESDPEDTQWLLEDFMPKVISSPCKTITFIIKEDSLLKEEIEQQSKALSQYFKVQSVDSLKKIIT
ncbi:hypothetical protein PGH07_00930 [Sulfurovum sp. zt1-1]|uniref:Uncharacterized protein n=1 Tax=Sulfurovum zhangzhouensis TaxID=3019067 RepID=A0ABT7QV62_9BACT|nr:hypothetical protein [Sulfurovum zhangzhouensis]MDM5270738.1 hypothetical protein [Sulfurovum zhangzhouensis]